MSKFTIEETERFNSKWVKNGNCHLWTGPLDKDGYGTFFFRRKPRRAHRVSYYVFNGNIPTGLVVDHICGNRNCVAPTHLRAITVAANNMDSRNVGAINARKTHCKYGHEFDRKYGKQRYCSTCQAEKTKRLRAKWYVEDTIEC